MLKEEGQNRFSLCRTIFALSWLVVIMGTVNYFFFGGPDVAAVSGAILTPAGLAYAAREHTKKN